LGEGALGARRARHGRRPRPREPGEPRVPDSRRGAGPGGRATVRGDDPRPGATRDLRARAGRHREAPGVGRHLEDRIAPTADPPTSRGCTLAGSRGGAPASALFGPWSALTLR